MKRCTQCGLTVTPDDLWDIECPFGQATRGYMHDFQPVEDDEETDGDG